MRHVIVLAPRLRFGVLGGTVAFRFQLKLRARLPRPAARCAVTTATTAAARRLSALA